MVICSAYSNSTETAAEGSLIITFLTGFLLVSLTYADGWTGNLQPIEGPLNDCTVPSSEVPKGASSTQIVSRFQYLACREYRSSVNHELYYQLESATDGEYIHLLPRPGTAVIDAEDYLQSVISAQRTCVKIRNFVEQRAILLSDSACSGHGLSL